MATDGGTGPLGTGTPDTGPLGTGQAPPASPSAAGQTPPPDRVPVPLAVVVVVTAVLAALVAVGATIQLTQQRLPTGPPRDPPAPTAPAETVQLGPGARQASIGPLSVTLPGPPYACEPEAVPALPTFAAAATCSAVVHRDYTGADDWFANAGLVLVPTALTVRGDPVSTGEKVLTVFRRQLYRGQGTTWKQLTTKPFADRALTGATLFGGDLGLRVAGLPSRYERVLLLLVPLGDGRYAGYFSARPEKTPAATLKVLDASLATLRSR